MNLAGLTTWIRGVCGFRMDTERDATIQEHVRMAQAFLERTLPLPLDFHASFTSTDTGDTFTLPSDFLRKDGDWLRVGTARWKYKEPREFDGCKGNLVWTIRNTGSGVAAPKSLVLGLQNTSGAEVFMPYWRKDTVLNDAADENWWSTTFPYLLGAQAGMHYAMQIQDEAAVQQFERTLAEQRMAFDQYVIAQEESEFRMGMQ